MKCCAQVSSVSSKRSRSCASVVISRYPSPPRPEWKQKCARYRKMWCSLQAALKCGIGNRRVAFRKQNPPKLWNAAHRFPVSVVNDPVLARLGWYRDIPHLLDLNESKNVQTTERCSIRCRQRWNAASWIVAFRVDCCSAEPRSKRMHASTCKRMLW